MNNRRRLLSSSKYNIICPCGVGDTLMVVGLLRSLKERISDCQFIIKSSHVCVMRMYGISEYRIADFSKEELYELAIKNRELVKGKFFVAHPQFYGNIDSYKAWGDYQCSFLQMYKEFLSIPQETELTYPTIIPELSEKVLKKLGGADVAEFTLIAPEINSYENTKVLEPYWKKRIAEILSVNKQVILNGVRDVIEDYKDYYLEMSFEDLVAIACRCKKVYSVRSGFTDLVYSFVKDMEVIYPDRRFFKMYFFDSMYMRNPNVKEIVISYADTLRIHGFESCAIYGYGKYGKMVYEKLVEDGYQIDYVIDKNADEIDVMLPKYKPHEKLPDTPLILVTVAKSKDILTYLKINTKIECHDFRYFKRGYD